MQNEQSAGYQQADSIDYRAMLAREVMGEDAWRVNGKLLRPADFVEIDTIAYDLQNGTNCREQVEDFCGEALA